MNAVSTIIGKEIRDGLRNRWVLATSVLLAALALALGLLGSAPTGAVKVDPLTVTVVSLPSLSSSSVTWPSWPSPPAQATGRRDWRCNGSMAAWMPARGGPLPC